MVVRKNKMQQMFVMKANIGFADVVKKF